MAHSIKTVYVVHHSHTDIGYTDLQERVIAIQVNYISKCKCEPVALPVCPT